MKKSFWLRYFITIGIIGLILIVSMRPGPYHDGIYEGKSGAGYIHEPYTGMVKIEIKNSHFTKIDFSIMDTLNNEIFDSTYWKHYIGNKIYIAQCRQDWKGVLYYPRRLIETQDIEKVDAISGATWSYNLFKQSTLMALKAANDSKH